jgi:parvulin-like peptidyl-prolyl isomerase
MTVVLQVRGQNIESHQIVPLLADYQLLSQFVRDLIIDQEIKDETLTSEEQEAGYKAFYAQNQIGSEEQLVTWLEQRQISRAQMGQLIERSLRIEKYKQATWGNKIDTYFLSRKAQLDRVIYSLIRIKDANMAQELYFRLKEEEQTFAELAAKYSLGVEAQTQGITGPVELGNIAPALAQLLINSQAAQILPPKQIGEWLIIVRLEKLIPAQMDQSMTQRLLNEMFNTWLQTEANQVQLNQNSKSTV